MVVKKASPPLRPATKPIVVPVPRPGTTVPPLVVSSMSLSEDANPRPFAFVWPAELKINVCGYEVR